ncbi:CDP-paratose 2-epimerase [Tolypothrix sp. PCC 7601]|nr:CDP-paratose 2-epimerase [Tolypothrix sp. PCC 7601]
MQQFNTAQQGFEAPKFQRLQLVQSYPWRSQDSKWLINSLA